MSQQKASKLLGACKRTFLELLEDLKSSVFYKGEDEADMTILILFVQKQPDEAIMENIVKFVLPHKDKMVEGKEDESYFVKNNGLFTKGLPESKVKYVCETINNKKRVTKEIKDGVWVYLRLLAQIAEEYKKNV
jgi:hypothetical protein